MATAPYSGQGVWVQEDGGAAGGLFSLRNNDIHPVDRLNLGGPRGGMRQR
jgi:hypothetical protein